jgi:hypothetical protein
VSGQAVGITRIMSPPLEPTYFAYNTCKGWPIIRVIRPMRIIGTGRRGPASRRTGETSRTTRREQANYACNTLATFSVRMLCVPQGESYKSLMETHFNVQRRLYDYQFSLTTTPVEFEQVHQTFMATYNTTAHQGLLKEQFEPPIPLQVLGQAKGRFYTPDELIRKFSRALFRFPAPRTHMAVSPSTATISMSNTGCPTPRCCCGCTENSYGQCWTTWS